MTGGGLHLCRESHELWRGTALSSPTSKPAHGTCNITARLRLLSEVQAYTEPVSTLGFQRTAKIQDGFPRRVPRIPVR